MFRQILVPLDGSDRAERALPVAVRIARQTQARLHLVRVDDVLSYGAWAGVPAYVPPGALEEQSARETNYLTTLQDRFSSEGVQVRSELLTGTAATSLLDYERALDIDLLVLCSHGRGGLARFALGSVADRLLHHGKAPVLLVHAFGESVSLEQVVLPLDGSLLAEAALTAIENLAGSVVRDVTLVRAIAATDEQGEAEQYLAGIEQRLQSSKIVCRSKVVLGDPAQTIIDAAGKKSLVIMATHGRTGLTRWALGSVADRVTHSGVSGALLVRSEGHPTAPAR